MLEHGRLRKTFFVNNFTEYQHKKIQVTYNYLIDKEHRKNSYRIWILLKINMKKSVHTKNILSI